jgi:hypothetical protein
MCSTEFTVHAEFTVHSAGLLTNSTGIRRLEILLFIFLIKWISVRFYQILPNLIDFFKNRQNRGGLIL